MSIDANAWRRSWNRTSTPARSRVRRQWSPNTGQLTGRPSWCRTCPVVAAPDVAEGPSPRRFPATGLSLAFPIWDEQDVAHCSSRGPGDGASIGGAEQCSDWSLSQFSSRRASSRRSAWPSRVLRLVMTPRPRSYGPTSTMTVPRSRDRCPGRDRGHGLLRGGGQCAVRVDRRWAHRGRQSGCGRAATKAAARVGTVSRAVRTVPLPIRSTRRGTNRAALPISRRVVLY